MPYGSGSKSDTPIPKAKCERLVVGSPTPAYMNWSWDGAFTSESWSRSGSDVNTSNPHKSQSKPRPKLKAWKLVPRFVTVKERKAVYIKGKGFRFRTIRTRERMMVWRLVNTKPPKGTKSKPHSNILLPNSLTFSKSTLKTSGSTVIAGYYTNGIGEVTTRRYTYAHLPILPRTPNWTVVPMGSTFFQPSEIPVFSTSEVERQARAQILNKAKSGAANAVVAFAERAQTIEMCKQMFSAAVRSLIALKAGKIWKAAKILFPTSSKELANQRLAYSFGLKPLVGDLDNIVKMLASGNQDDQTFDLVAVATRTYNDSQTRSFNYGIKGTSSMLTKCEITCKYKMRVKIPSTATRNATLLGLTNPAEVAWELIPFSFVVDWFLPIGNYLASVDSLFGLNVVWCTKTVVVKTTSQGFATTGGTDTDGFVWGSSNSNWTSETVSVVRTIIDPATVTPPLPQFNSDPINMGRLLNALALLRQRI